MGTTTTQATVGALIEQIERALTMAARHELAKIAEILSDQCVPLLQRTLKGSNQDNAHKGVKLFQKGTSKVLEALELLSGGENFLRNYVAGLRGNGSGSTSISTSVSISIDTGQGSPLTIALDDLSQKKRSSTQGKQPSRELSHEQCADTSGSHHGLIEQIELALSMGARVKLVQIAEILSVQCVPLLRHTLKGSNQENAHKGVDLFQKGTSKIFEALELLSGGENFLREYLANLRGKGTNRGLGVSISIDTGQGPTLAIGLSDVSQKKTSTSKGSQPSCELSHEERADIVRRQYDLECKYPEESEKLQKDLDHGEKVNLEAQVEARTVLDLWDQGKLPHDVTRPAKAGQGDFHSQAANESYDIKGVHSFWPPLSRNKDSLLPFKEGNRVNREQVWVKVLDKQITQKNRTVILNTVNAKQETIDLLASIVDKHGWGNHVIWYP